MHNNTVILAADIYGFNTPVKVVVTNLNDFIHADGNKIIVCYEIKDNGEYPVTVEKHCLNNIRIVSVSY